MSAAAPSIIDVVILAAGEGSRIRAHFPTIPKPLIPVRKKPMLVHILEHLHYVAITLTERTLRILGTVHIVVPASRKDEFEQQVLRWVNKLRLQFTFPLAWVPQDSVRKGTGYALQTAIPSLSSTACTHVLVLNGDMPFLSGPLLVSTLVAAFAAPTHPLALVALRTPSPPPQGLGTCVLDASTGLCRRILETYETRHDASSPPTQYYNAGVYFGSHSFFRDQAAALQPCPLSGEIRITDLVLPAGAHVLECGEEQQEQFLNINTYYDWMLADAGPF